MMPSIDREERLQMRQRGAATRKIKDFDFGLSFGVQAPSAAPLRPQRSSRKTPQPDSRRSLPPQGLSRRTPARNTRQPSASRSSAPRNSTRSKRPGVYDLLATEDTEGQPGSSKRRKLGDSSSRLKAPASHGSANTQASSDSILGGPSGNRIKKKSYAEGVVIEDAVAEEELAPSGSFAGQQGKQIRVPTLDTWTANKENEAPDVRGTLQQPDLTSVSPEDTKKKRRKKRKSIGQQRTKHRPSLELVQEQDVQAEDEAGSETEAEAEAELVQTVRQAQKPRHKKRKSIGQRRTKHRTSLDSVQEEEAETEDEAHSEAEAGPEEAVRQAQKPRGKKRRSIGQVRKKHKRSSGDIPEGQAVDHGRIIQDNNATASSARLDAVRGKPAKRSHQAAKEDAVTPSGAKAPNKLSKSLDGNQVRERSKKQGSKATKPNSSADGNLESNSRAPKNTVPVLVHRLTGIPAHQDDSDDSNDELLSTSKFPKRGGVNAADVLSQICRETIETSIDKIQRAAESENNKGHSGELKRKRKAIEAFGTELDGRLFQISEALDNNYALSARLKRANKEKAALREEFLRIRREREEIALKMDEVRRRHQDAEMDAQEHNDLNMALHDLELAAERGGRVDREGDSADGMELLLRTVTDDVSSLGERGGLLNQVKEFNAMLERTALVLEGRNPT